MTSRTGRLHSRRASRLLRHIAMERIYTDTLVDVAEELRQMELALQDAICSLDACNDITGDPVTDADEDDFNTGQFTKSNDENVKLLLRLLQQVSATCGELENKNAIEI